ncbi:MAG: VWA domain-containing protein [Pseudomonadota bacterium]
MIEVAGILWLRPGFLALLPLALVAGLWLGRHAGRLGAWERAADPELLAAMRRLGRVHSGGAGRAIMPACVLAALGIALAGPAMERRDSASWRNLDGVVLVVDLSPSVVDSGRLFDMLAAARLVAEAAGTRQTALIVYAGEAYLAAPFSTDARALSGMIALLDAETVPVPGSRPAAALALARQVLEGSEIVAADVVMLSDGGAIDAATITEAQALGAQGWTVSTIAMPGADAGALDAVAVAGGGQAGDLADPFAVAGRIGARPIERLAATEYAMLVLDDYGRYLLVLALLPALLLLPRRHRA